MLILKHNPVRNLPYLARWHYRRAGLCLVLLSVLLLPYGLIRRQPLAGADAIVVLSGSATYIERAQRAAQLWHAGRAPQIILTYDGQSAGWDERRQRNPSFSEREADVLRAEGVPAERIVMLPQLVTTTHEELERVRDYAHAHELSSLIVVTSAYHTRRAWWTMRQIFANGGTILGLDAPPPGQQTPVPLLWWTSIVGWKLVPGEYLKCIYYRLRY